VAHAGNNPSDPGLRLDFLTPMTRASHKPVRIPNLNVALQPLRFMDFCLDGVYRAALLANDGAVWSTSPPRPASRSTS
jgi:hypothetical protein